MVPGITEEFSTDGTVAYRTSDGATWRDLARAEIIQEALNGGLTQPTALATLPDGSTVQVPRVVGPVQINWISGEGFVQGDSPDGDAILCHDHLSSRLVWRVNPATLDAIQSLSPTLRAAKVAELKRTREGGGTVASGVVKPNTRRGAPTRERPVSLQPLIDRAQALVTSIIGLDNPNDGQVGEITKSVVALQAERDAIAEQLEELDGHLSIGRAVILAHSDPRSVTV